MGLESPHSPSDKAEAQHWPYKLGEKRDRRATLRMAALLMQFSLQLHTEATLTQQDSSKEMAVAESPCN